MAGLIRRLQRPTVLRLPLHAISSPGPLGLSLIPSPRFPILAGRRRGPANVRVRALCHLGPRKAAHIRYHPLPLSPRWAALARERRRGDSVRGGGDGARSTPLTARCLRAAVLCRRALTTSSAQAGCSGAARGVGEDRSPPARACAASSLRPGA